jgi:hypothetical protein
VLAVAQAWQSRQLADGVKLPKLATNWIIVVQGCTGSTVLPQFIVRNTFLTVHLPAARSAHQTNAHFGDKRRGGLS